MLVLLALALASSLAHAQEKPLKGVALVVGQSAYQSLPKLANPANDARAIDKLLGDLGFDVMTVTDADQKKLSRSLSRFVEDAEGADVALIYYSGHGIEAGGENFLVPVDASVASLEDAGKRLVPVSGFLAELQKAAPVTIVLLDACRSNPFPPGSVAKVGDDAAPAPVGASGLGTPRGAVPLAATADGKADGLGAVVGYAAAPGRAALDGEAGANSPYAAALLKHLAAGGFAFSDVMTMVTEEVYLKTDARQTPWTNNSLRRTLYFGATEDDAGDEGQIRGERRKLLLTIAQVGDPEKKQVAATARENSVPMDALFAMLRAVGADTPRDPGELARLLQEQSARLKTLIAESDTLKSADPQIARLASLADEAVKEGALESAIAFHEKAKARVAALSATVDDAEAALKAKRLEFAKVFADSAATYALAFDPARAAEDFGKAYEQAARWDDALALTYKLRQAKALADLGFYRGDPDALGRSQAAYREAIAAARNPGELADSRAGLALALWHAGERQGGTQPLDEAAAVLDTGLKELDRASDPRRWAALKGDQAFVLATLGARESGTERLEAAASALHEAIEASDRAADPLAWALLQNRLGATLLSIGERKLSPDAVKQAAAAFELALAERRQDVVPIEWAETTNNLAIALSTLGERDPDPARLKRSVDLYRAALGVETRERVPMLWAEAQSNLGTSLFALGGRGGGGSEYQQAAEAFRLALQEITRERAPLKWAALQDNLGLALSNIGERTKQADMIGQALAAFDLALQERRRTVVPLDWASTMNNAGNAHYRLGELTSDAAELQNAIAAYQAALEERTREKTPLDWSRTRNNMGNALYDIGMLQQSAERLSEAAEQYRLSLSVRSKEDDAFGWAQAQNNIGQTLLAAGRLGQDKAMLAQARAAIEAARDVLAGAGQTQYADYFATSLAQVELAMAEADIAQKLKAAGK